MLRRRGELLERPFAHALETGGMRRTHLRRHGNILKRVLVHVAGLNLGLLMRTIFGVGKPRCLQGRPDLLGLLLHALILLWAALVQLWRRQRQHRASNSSHLRDCTDLRRLGRYPEPSLRFAAFTTGC